MHSPDTNNLDITSINRLMGLDPYLDPDWQETLYDIIPKLDNESKAFVFKTILSPKGITYNKSLKQFLAKPAKTLSEVLKSLPMQNQQLLKVAESLQNFYQSAPDNRYDALLLVDELEAVLTYLDKVAVNPDKGEHRHKNALKTAFLYEFAHWLDGISLIMPESLRQISESIFKIFTKEVFIKSVIQGRDFRFFEAADLDLYDITNFPEFIKQEAINRKLLLVETKDIWFAVSPSETLGSNPFSLRRFLFEDNQGGYIYFNGLALTKKAMDNPEIQAVILKFTQRIFSLDRNISEEIKRFAIHIRQMIQSQFAPILLDSKFVSDGSDAEQTVQKRIIKFEELLSTSVLQKLPPMINIAKNSEFDQEFLFQKLNGFFSELLILVKNFRMHPIARYSFAAEHLQLRILAHDVLIQKNRSMLFDPKINSNEIKERLSGAMNAIRECYEEKMDSLADLEELIANTKAYDDKKASGGFFAKLGFGKPKYTLEELTEAKQNLDKEFFVDIVKIAKEHRQAIVYVEYETDFEINENFRHYAIANDTYGVTRLPYIISLPEDRELFSLEDLENNVYWGIFKQDL